MKYENHPRVLTVRYEDLVYHFEREIKRISEFLGEDFVPTREEWTQLTSLKKSKHWGGPVQNLYTKSIGRWKKPEHQKRVEEFMSNPEAVELMKRLKYLEEETHE
jgi:hypothetical protein